MSFSFHHYFFRNWDLMGDSENEMTSRFRAPWNQARGPTKTSQIRLFGVHSRSTTPILIHLLNQVEWIKWHKQSKTHTCRSFEPCQNIPLDFFDPFLHPTRTNPPKAFFHPHSHFSSLKSRVCHGKIERGNFLAWFISAFEVEAVLIFLPDFASLLQNRSKLWKCRWRSGDQNGTFILFANQWTFLLP